MSMITQRHFEAIGTIIATARSLHPEAVPALDDVTEGLADYFATDNPRFDRESFIAGCGSPWIP